MADDNGRDREMAWWWKRQEPTATSADKPETATDNERDYPRQIQPETIPVQRTDDGVTDQWEAIKRDLLAVDPDFFEGLNVFDVRDPEPQNASELTDERLKESLRRLSVRYLVDEAGALMAMWERHVLQIRREGRDGDILVLRARAFSTLPVEWSDRACGATNEWNRTRRFLKAYVGEPTESGRLPLYGEMQLPLHPGLSDALLDELIDCAAAVSGAYVDWLHTDGAVL